MTIIHAPPHICKGILSRLSRITDKKAQSHDPERIDGKGKREYNVDSRNVIVYTHPAKLF